MRYIAAIIICVSVLWPARVQAQEAEGKTGHRSFGIDCMECHTTTNWNDLRPQIDFEHKLTGYPLRGNHASVTCTSCHAGIPLDELKTDCASCHKDQHKGELGNRCGDCHTPAGWRSPNEAVARHQLTRFPLLGAHAMADCQACHINQAEREYVNTSSECFTCHREDYERAKEPDHLAGGFDKNCVLCHDMGDPGWKGGFVHPAFTFMQTAAHTALACADCHAHGYAGTPQDCFGCHESDYRQVKQPDHVTGGYDRDCTRCHEPVHWTPATFDHNRTTFPLEGAHAATPCTACHETGFSRLPTDCWSCHEKNYQATTFPDHTGGLFSHECLTCHNVRAWSPAEFDHDLTNFRLTGAHLRSPCQSCHVSGQYSGLALDCQGCHEADFTQSSQPNHVLVGFVRQCADCHNTEAWQPLERMPVTIDHDKTRFPLIGKHRTVLCEDCHAGLVFAGTPVECFACHERDYVDAKNPDHQAGGFDRDCMSCHNMDGWKPADFDHTRTAFPLDGAHAAEPCESCHINGDYSFKYADCWQCHETDFTATQNPNHVSAQFAHDCTTCHGTAAWVPSTFDHGRTAFSLTGAHAAEPCESCHINGDYSFKYTDCWQCHETDFNATQNPNHISAQFAHDCTTCHGTAAWVPSSFNHAQTAFPLTGAHAAQACESCHINGDYSFKYTDCWQCHETDFTATQNPNHVSAQFAHDCTTCHGTTTWVPSTFDHGQTAFPLTGAHAAQACESCHINGDYSFKYTDCWQCHESDFTATQNPNHVSAQFAHDCTTCHNNNAWVPSTFDHAQTAFPLTGAHAAQACESCHIGGNYNLTYTDCWQCHETDFTATQNPNHVSAQFAHDCTTCHNNTAWVPSTFDHAQTAFPLTGAHAAPACESCHISGNYNLTYTDCWQCHETDYNTSQNPDHAAGQFDHDCTTCHDLNAWQPATFDHAATAFPLQGAHAAEPCQSCHIGGNYTLTYTDCWQCHEADFQATVNPAHASNLFPHDCRTCHNENSWVPSTFDHAATAFPLTGAHQTRPCLDCHTGGNYALTYSDCYQCHQTDYQTALNPGHASNQFSFDCTSCHTTTSWRPSTFNHASTNFPITGAHTSAACLDCHTGGNYTLMYTDCYQCHQSDYTSATLPANHATMNLDHNCAVCHSQSNWEPATLFRTSHNVNAPTGFPIYGSVKHKYQDEWDRCNECHTTNVTSTFCCTSCHEHNNKNELDNEHQNVTGYSYNCTSCAGSGCHPDGREP